MFPLNWNIPFIRKNGSRTTLGNIIENVSSELPPHSAGDAGKLLGVKADGSVEWSNTVNSEIQTLTNKIGTLEGNLSDGYIFLGTHAITVAPDNDTVSTMIDKLLAGAQSYIDTLSNDMCIALDSAYCPGTGLFAVHEINRNIRSVNNLIIANAYLNVEAVRNRTSEVVILSGALSPSKQFNRLACKLSDNTWSNADKLSETVTGDSTITLSVYRKVASS